MQPTGIVNKEILEPSIYKRVLFVAGSNIEVVEAIETTPYVTYFLSPKYKGFFSLLLSGSVNRALSASYYSVTIQHLACS